MKKLGGHHARLDSTVDCWWDFAKLRWSVARKRVFCEYLFTNTSKMWFTKLKPTISLHYFINDLKRNQYSRYTFTALIISSWMKVNVAALMIIIQWCSTITIHSFLLTLINCTRLFIQDHPLHILNVIITLNETKIQGCYNQLLLT